MKTIAYSGGKRIPNSLVYRLIRMSALVQSVPVTTIFDSPSILGEALYAGLGRLAMLLQRELDRPPLLVADTLAEALGFPGWEELCDRAIRTTSRDVDGRLLLLGREHLDRDLIERLAIRFGTTDTKIRRVLHNLRDACLEVSVREHFARARRLESADHNAERARGPSRARSLPDEIDHVSAGVAASVRRPKPYHSRRRPNSSSRQYPSLF